MAEAKENKSKKARNVCFTINLKDGRAAWRMNLGSIYEENKDKIKYVVAQLEMGEEKTLHYQGYVEFTSQVLYNTIKRVFNCEWMHLEARRGSAQQASEYCKKEEGRVEGPWEFGEISGQGKRSDIHEAVDLIKKGAPMKQVATEHSVAFVKYHKGFKELQRVIQGAQRRPHDEMRLYIWCGPPGCGKTWWANELFPEAYQASDTEQGWFDGYDGEKVIVFDEFCSKFPLQQLLKLCDGQPMQCQTKGGWVNICATTIVIISNNTLDSLYDTHSNKAAFSRRVNEFSKKYNLCWDHGEEPEEHPLKLSLSIPVKKRLPYCGFCGERLSDCVCQDEMEE